MPQYIRSIFLSNLSCDISKQNNTKSGVKKANILYIYIDHLPSQRKMATKKLSLHFLDL